MKINVNDCLKLDSFRNAKVLSCAEMLDRRVKSVSVFDEADLGMGVERNGEKDQMVLTHFWTCSHDLDVQKKIVYGLAAKGVSALVLFLNERGLSSVSEEVVNEAETAGLPRDRGRDHRGRQTGACAQLYQASAERIRHDPS